MSQKRHLGRRRHFSAARTGMPDVSVKTTRRTVFRGALSPLQIRRSEIACNGLELTDTVFAVLVEAEGQKWLVAHDGRTPSAWVREDDARQEATECSSPDQPCSVEPMTLKALNARWDAERDALANFTRRLDGIVRLERQSDTMSLWGVTSEGERIWLGSPGWWAGMDDAKRRAVEAFLNPIREAGGIPDWPGEWSQVSDFRSAAVEEE